MTAAALPHGRPVAQPWPAPTYRACELCTHGHSDDGDARLCAEPGTAAAGRPVPVALARAWHGRCGPDATLMTTPWLR